MSNYTVQDTETGKKITFAWEGKSPPTDADMSEIFAAAKGTPTTEVTPSNENAGRTQSVLAGLAKQFGQGLQTMSKPIPNVAPILGAIAGGTAGAASPIPGGMAIGSAGGYYAGKQIERGFQTGQVGTPQQQVGDLTEAAGQEVAGKVIGNTLSAVINKFKPMATSLYESALKPSTTLKASTREARVNTALSNEIPVSKKGLATSKEMIIDLNKTISDRIANDTGITISRDNALSPLGALSEKVSSTKIDASSDLVDIAKYVDDIQSSRPEQIPIQQAQTFKQTLNKELNEYYAAFNRGKITPPQVYAKSKAAMADGLRSEISSVYPELQSLNSKEGSLIELNKSLERAVNRIRNREIIPLLAGIAFGTSSTHGILKALVLKAVEHPEVKSKLAIALYKAMPETAGQIGKIATQTGFSIFSPLANMKSSPTSTQVPQKQDENFLGKSLQSR